MNLLTDFQNWVWEHPAETESLEGLEDLDFFMSFYSSLVFCKGLRFNHNLFTEN